MNNDKLQQAGEKFREAASLMGEWLSDQFRSAIDMFSTMAKSGISANGALDALLTAHRAAGRIREAPEGKGNNWLKMHGYPMRREVAGRHGRRKEHICRNHSGSCPEDNMDSVKINTKSQDALLKLNQKYITARGKIYLLKELELIGAETCLKLLDSLNSQYVTLALEIRT